MRERSTRVFKEFFESEKSSGIVLIFVTILSLFIANSSFSDSYLGFWKKDLFNMKIESWVNDVLMSFFFLLIGLELKREFQEGELSSFKKAVLPIFSALGGMIFPALFYLIFNFNTSTSSGYGIPMATDIAFALGALSLLGNRVPLSIKVFLTALAVIDDLGAIVVIALFYSKGVVFINLAISLSVFTFLLIMNKLKVNFLIMYLIGGGVMWYFMHHSGIHATITGVLLALTIPTANTHKKSLSIYLQEKLHKPIPYFVLPIFAMANTAIVLGTNWDSVFKESYSFGIMAGLVLGKPIGITLFTFLAVKLKMAEFPSKSKWGDLIGVACLGGIGFTMSIFVTLLAFTDSQVINNAKFIIIISSVIAGFIGINWLKISLKKNNI